MADIIEHMKAMEKRFGKPEHIPAQRPAGVDAPWTGPQVVQRITAIFEQGEREQKKVHKRGEIPHNYNLITKEWLTDVIAGDNHPGAQVLSFKNGEVDNGTSNRMHITFEWNDVGKKAGLPASAFCKSTTALPNRINLSFGAIHGETTFFMKLRQLIDFEAPTAMYSDYDMESCNSITLCHDLTGKVEFLDYQTEATDDLIRKQLDTLARLHGKFWLTKNKDVKSLVTFSAAMTGQWAAGDASTYNMYGFKCAKDVIPERLYAQYNDIWPATLVALTRNARAPYTLVHSDLHLGNWYLLPNGEVGLQDWQCCARGFWARDIAYFLAAVPTIERRRQHEKEYLKIYLDLLQQNGGPVITPEEAWPEIAVQLFAVIHYWTHVYTPTPGSMPGFMQPHDVTLENVKRIAYMMDDWDSVDQARRLNGGRKKSRKPVNNVATPCLYRPE